MRSHIINMKKICLQAVKLFFLFALILIASKYVSLTTHAVFSERVNVSMNLSTADKFNGGDAGWDKSQLIFVKQDESGNCSKIEAWLMNEQKAGNKKVYTDYKVYYIEHGNPEHGIVVATGKVPLLKAGETYVLTYQPKKPGFYIFMAEQSPGYPGEKNIWSKKIHIKDCT
ncbi:amyloid fiber anchoring/assembly protein TapA [Scopulibacillus cellulosilyticus]|uniref:Amyloid fiber anchoring/assembly protein TapA n=1 Tax=Scopulibacillus cellulosilyticus TaxID=2665665 RepID=A0ABW2PVJ3_9BACL